MQKIVVSFFVASLLISTNFSQSYKILESNSNFIKIEFNFLNAYSIEESMIDGVKFNSIIGKEINLRKSGQPSLPDFRVTIGIPHNSQPTIKILHHDIDKISSKFILPTPDSLNQPFNLLQYDQSIYSNNQNFPQNISEINSDVVMRYARLISVSVAPYQYNPVTRELTFNKRITIQIDFNSEFEQKYSVSTVDDKMTNEILQSSVINYSIAKNFVGKITAITNSPAIADSYWYNPVKDWYKIYLKEKGVYRITYDWLVSSGVPANTGLQNMNLELFCNGESIPIDVVDVNQDQQFNSGDYFQFVGEPAKRTNQFTTLNIYNNSNVYWFSYEADSVNLYNIIDGYIEIPFPVINTTVETLVWEQDKIYHNFGRSDNDQRDYWYWGTVERRNNISQYYFEHIIKDSFWLNMNETKTNVKLRVGLHGLTSSSCSQGAAHTAQAIFNGHPIGTAQWNGQNSWTLQKDFYLSTNYIGGDTAWMNWGNDQQLILNSLGATCDDSLTDIFLVNNIEFDYWRWNRSNSNHYYFKSPPNDFQQNIYQVWQWDRDHMKIYIPSRGDIITNPLIANDQYRSVYFVDTISVQTEYFCVANDHYFLADSISRDERSDLRNISNRADYIIITHPKFKNSANVLASYRASNLSGFENPTTIVVDVFDIYDEFSFGLLNPYALQSFVKYAFENWQNPAPSFVVLLGDGSYDYRKIFPSSRENFIPSIPYHAQEYGQLPSDNLIVAVSGSDISPDLALGRLSCETIDEANELVNKIINYPSDNTKVWKENILLLASGLSLQDQISFGFNNASKQLENLFLRPNGLHTTKVFNFPEPHDMEFLGSGPRMREEINKGAALVNYYGHGGGAQWDLIFTKDDLYELENQGRQPLALSITCYTAHFDNATAFGEVFTRLPGKGAIGFWGSVGLTWWSTGQQLNQRLFNQLFNLKNHVIGNAILNAKASQGGGFFDEMIAQLSYLGDPAIELCLPKYPDFQITSSDISITPENPLVDDTVLVNIKIKNLGVTFNQDSVVVQLFENLYSPEKLIGEKRMGSFGDVDSILFQWIPKESNLYTLFVYINELDTIWELDHSDNFASNNFAVFSFDEPNIVKPINGFYTPDSNIDFVISDVGSIFNREFNYKIEIDTSESFNSSIRIISPELRQSHNIVEWKSPELSQGEYFWRAIIYDEADTNRSVPRFFSVHQENGTGFFIHKKLLDHLNKKNTFYSDSLKSLVLNTELLPPFPNERFYLDSLIIDLPADSTMPTVFTTDGTYFYYGCLPSYASGNPSRIYKIGTGLNGTIAGENYGSIPSPELYINSSLIFHSGKLYAYSDSTQSLLVIDPNTGDTSSVPLIDSLLLTKSKPTQLGGAFLYSDGDIVYNLAIGTEEYPDKFIVRKFDPENNWAKIGEDIFLNGFTVPAISSFIVVDDYLITYENLFAYYMRRYRLSDAVFEEEWSYTTVPKNYLAVNYDHTNNFIYFNSYSQGSSIDSLAFVRYQGTYKDAAGTISSTDIGPASKWSSIIYDIDNTGSTGTYSATLFGRNRSTQAWDTLAVGFASTLNIDTLDADIYDYLRFNMDMVDSSFGASEPLKFKSLKLNYTSLPELVISPDEYSFSADTLLHGFPVDMQLKIRNVGYTDADSLRLAVHLNDSDSAYFTRSVSVKKDSVFTLNETIITDKLLYTSPVSEIKLKVVAENKEQEFYTFNNIVENQFYISRDSIKPVLTVTFDGQEIFDDDIISSKPEIVIKLNDNSPLPLTENLFTLIYTVNDSLPRQLNSARDNLEFNYTSSPNSEATFTWRPILSDGRHELEILAKDSSGNYYFDSTVYSRSFYVFNKTDLREVFNYPNPFKDDTYFTFQLRGFEAETAENIQIKVFTVAGRLIRDLTVPASQLRAGFNKIYWDGRDQDGDIIANGLYLYKVIARLNGETKTVTQKLAKLK